LSLCFSGNAQREGLQNGRHGLSLMSTAQFGTGNAYSLKSIAQKGYLRHYLLDCAFKYREEISGSSCLQGNGERIDSLSSFVVLKGRLNYVCEQRFIKY
jgi:hypothetical protein